MKSDFTVEVMSKIACGEEKRLKLDLKILLPVTIFLLVLTIFFLQRSILFLLERNADDFILAIEKSEITLDQYLVKVWLIIWERLELQLFIAFVLSTAALIVLFIKSQLLSMPGRFREIRKYK